MRRCSHLSKNSLGGDSDIDAIDSVHDRRRGLTANASNASNSNRAMELEGRRHSKSTRLLSSSPQRDAIPGFAAGASMPSFQLSGLPMDVASCNSGMPPMLLASPNFSQSYNALSASSSAT